MLYAQLKNESYLTKK